MSNIHPAYHTHIYQDGEGSCYYIDPNQFPDTKAGQLAMHDPQVDEFLDISEKQAVEIAARLSRLVGFDFHVKVELLDSDKSLVHTLDVDRIGQFSWYKNN